ncbi:hypothetical protein [Tissierella sp.]|uniref:hypothetical protein n=1 Tax=Tissierella sp. TaxID=41274 RepID=UPI0028AF5C31|nr:hypothetical protein [Tissierella sp.]
MDKDRLGSELKIIMEDETRDMEFTQGLKDRILIHRKKTLRDKIRGFLNKEIELPLVPMVAGFAILFIVVGVPKNLMIRNENIRIVDIGSSQMIIRDERRVNPRHEN